MGESSEFTWGAPAVFTALSQGSVAYWFAIARAQVKFVQDTFVVILFVDIEPDVPRTYRVEQYGEEQYIWYIDGQIAHAGVPGGPYPKHNPAIAWRAKSAFLTAEVRWSYIRYGDIPTDASFDFDSDGDVDHQDYYYVSECLGKDGPGIFGRPEKNAGPGCRFADSDGDGDVDLKDIATFQNAFTGEGD